MIRTGCGCFRRLGGVCGSGTLPVELLGAVLVMVPGLALVGAGLLAATMAAAVGIVALVLHRPADAFYPGVFLVGVVGVGIWWWRAGR